MGTRQTELAAAQPVANAARAMVEVFAAAGVDVVFGNPGTTEIPLIKQLTAPGSGVRYVLALQEGTAVSAASGHALATGRTGVALVHAMPGLGNSVSMHFNAFRGGVPLLLIAGQQDRRHQYLNPLLQADMTDVMRSISKEVWEVKTAAELPDVLERALATAAASPAGPVFLSIPVDLLDEPVAMGERRKMDSATRLGPVADHDLDLVAELLAGAEAPVFIAGDLVGMRRAGAALEELAELSAARAFWPPGAGLANFPTTSPFHAGHIFHNEAAFTRAFRGADVAFFVGAELQGPILFFGTELVPRSVRVVSLTETPAEPVGAITAELAVYGAIEESIRRLTKAVAAKLDTADRSSVVAQRRELVRLEGTEQHRKLRERALVGADSLPMSGSAAISPILDAAPDDVVVVDESVSNAWVSLIGEFRDELSYLAVGRGGALGHALGVAVGAQVAVPHRPALVIVGDGAILYGLQGLWTFAHERLPIVICVVNNSGYAILKDFLFSEHFSPELAGDSENAMDAELEMLSISDPPIDIVGVARAYGLDAVRVNGAEECRAAVEAAFASKRPWLIDVTVEHRLRKGA
jgi:benzoylformate decarboxylase